MKQNFKRILLVQGIVLTSIGVFANVSLHGALLRDTVNSTKNRVAKTILTERLVSFNAAYKCHQIDLHWDISNGNNYDHFFVERSLDGINFEKIGEVKGISGASAVADYGFSDFVKPAIARKNDLYYRLKQIGENNASYSKILIVRMYNSKSVTAVSVTPDPAINDILVNVQLKENSFVVMTVRDNNGDLLLKKATHAENGANQFSLDGTSKLKAGNYQLEVTINSNERMTMQLIKG